MNEREGAPGAARGRTGGAAARRSSRAGPEPAAAQQASAEVAAVLRLQRAAGNGAVGMLLAGLGGRGLPPATPEGAGALAPGAALAVQRQAPPAPAASLSMGPVTVSTFDGLLAASHLLTSQLTTDAADVPAGEPSRTAADDLVKQARAWEPYLLGKGGDSLDEAAVNQAQVWYQAFTRARQDLETYKKAKARADMEKSASEADEARAAVEGIPDQLADYQRGAFLAKNEDLLEKLTTTVGKALQVSSALLEIHEKCMEMVGWLNNEITHVDELVEKIGPMAEIAHKVVAAYEGLHAALTILRGGEGATEVDESMSKVSAGFGLAGAAGSLTGMASAYMVYFGVLLSAGQACLEVVAVIVREHAQRGGPDKGLLVLEAHQP